MSASPRPSLVRPIAFLLLSIIASAEDGTVIDGELGKALDSAVEAQRTPDPFWGVVLVAKGGSVVLAKGYGNADYKSLPNDTASLFEIASTSKMFTATAILKLETQGKLATTDLVSKYFKGVPADKKAITIQHLLNHTSGMTPEGLLPYQCDQTADELVKLAMAQPLVGKPGEKFVYSNVGYSLLAVIIEKATGGTFEAYMRKQLFEPAGMKDTGFVKDAALDAKRATVRLDGQTKEPVGTAIDWGWSWGYRGMGGIVTTAWDLHRFDRAMRADKILNLEARQKQMVPAKDGYGCGCLMLQTASGSRIMSHAGSVSGYLCAFSRYVDDDALVVILTNNAGDIFGLEKQLAEILVAPPPIQLSIDVKGQNLNEGGGLVIPKGASWRATRTGDDIVLSLMWKDAAVAKATIRGDSARVILVTVEESIAARTKAGEKDDGSMEAGVFTGGLPLKAGHLDLDNVVFELMSNYNGGGPIDPRMTLVLKDPATGQWPVMAHMSLTGAGQLAKTLKQAIDSGGK